MNLAKKHLIPFFLALKETDGQLTLKEARIRDQMLKPLLEITKTFEEDRTKIYQKYGELKDGQYHFKDEDTDTVNKEVQELYAEEVELPHIKGIKEILEKTEYKPKFGEAELIDEVIKSFE